MKVRSLSILTAAMLLTAGCGGGGSTAPSTHGSPAPNSSQRLFVSQAEGICRRLNAEFAAHKPANQGLGEILRLAPGRAVAEKRVVAELSRLAPPGSMAASMREIIALRRTLASELAKLAAAAKAKDQAAINALARSKEAAHKKLSLSAGAAGITACAQTG